MVLTIDGGRIRHRKNKRGKRKEGLKRCSYDSSWIEPKLFVIYTLNEKGEPQKVFSPIVDGTIGVKAFMELLKSYISTLKIQDAEEVVLCADGAPWIWERTVKLLHEVGVSPEKLFEVIDYTHAKQNLYEVYDKLSKKHRQEVSISQWKNFLWEGRIEDILSEIKKVCKRSKHKALSKFESYFVKNKHRMKYKKNTESKRPCGSGVVESAIRRVINLRLKSCGTFWKEEKLEIMLYLRAQLLYGRWDNLYRNCLKVS